MSDTAANKKAIQEAYRKWNECKGESTDMWVDLVADNAILGSGAAGVTGGEFATSNSGTPPVSDFLGVMTSTWKMLDWKVDHTVAEDDKVMIFGKCHWKHRQTDAEYESEIMSFFRFDGGKIVEFFETLDTQALTEAATPKAEPEPMAATTATQAAG